MSNQTNSLASRVASLHMASISHGAAQKEVAKILERLSPVESRGQFDRKRSVNAIAQALSKSDVVMDFLAAHTPQYGWEGVAKDLLGPPLWDWKEGWGIGEDSDADSDYLGSDIGQLLKGYLKGYTPKGVTSRDFSKLRLMLIQHRSGLVNLVKSLDEGSTQEEKLVSDLKTLAKAFMREVSKL